jgi:hypothetical protein
MGEVPGAPCKNQDDRQGDEWLVHGISVSST